jgi:hypothetical protein
VWLAECAHERFDTLESRPYAASFYTVKVAESVTVGRHILIKTGSGAFLWKNFPHTRV